MYKHSELTSQIIKAAQNVHNALLIELKNMGLDAESEK